MKYLISIVAITLLISGCSSQPRQPPIFSESFITKIGDHDIRFFTYEVAFSRPNDKGGPGMHRGNMERRRPQGSDGASMPVGMRNQVRKIRENSDKAILQRLEEILAETQYCPSGYMILDKNTLSGKNTIRGECR